MGKPAWSHAVRGTEPIAAIDEKLLKYYEASAEPVKLFSIPVVIHSVKGFILLTRKRCPPSVRRGDIFFNSSKAACFQPALLGKPLYLL